MDDLQAECIQDFFKWNSSDELVPLRWLWQAQRDGVQVGNTLVLGREVLRYFSQKEHLPFPFIDTLLNRLRGKGTRLRISVSGTAQSPPFPREFTIASTSTTLKASLESVYRQWTNEESRAYRIVNGLSETDLIPIVALQAVPKRLYQFCTREPSTGDPTSPQNYRDHLGNTLPWLRDPMLRLFRQLEKTLKRPVEGIVSLLDSPTLWEVFPETMTDRASLRCSLEMLDCGMIDDLGFIQRIEPPMLAGEMFADFQDSSGPTLRGLSVGHPTTVIARMRIAPDKSVLQRGESFIIALREASPEDLGYVKASDGILTSKGGMSSHAALVARFLGKPCVVCSELDFDYMNRRILIADGRVFQDGDYCILNGSSGQVQFGNNSNAIKFRRKAVAETIDYRQKIETILGQVSRLERFRLYPLEVQHHIGSLQRALRLSNIGKP